MAISLVQSKSASATPSSNGSFTLTISLTSTVTPGNTLVVGAGTTAQQVDTMTAKIGGSADNFTLGYQFQRNFSGSAVVDRLFYDPNIGVSSNSVTVLFSGVEAFAPLGGFVWEVAGLGSSPVLDVFDGTGGSGSPYSTGSGVITNYANEFWAYCASSGSTLTAAASPWSSFASAGGAISGYQITTSTGTAHASGSYTSPGNQFAAVLICLAAGSTTTNVTDTDAFNPADDEVVQQSMASSDASISTVESGAILLSQGETGGGSDTLAPTLTGHPSASDVTNGPAIDLPVGQFMSASDANTATVETPLPRPVGTDANSATVEAAGSQAALSDSDTFNTTIDISPAPVATVTSSDLFGGTVENSSITTNIKTDSDLFGTTVEALIAIGAVLPDSDLSTGFDIGVRFPVTDTDSGSFTDTVLAYGSVIVATDAFIPALDAGSTGLIKTDSDNNAATTETPVLHLAETEGIQGTENTNFGTTVLNDSDSFKGIDTGFVNFEGTSRESQSALSEWKTLQRKTKSTAADWVTLQRKTKNDPVAWRVIKRLSDRQLIGFVTLERVTGMFLQKQNFWWNTMDTVTKTAITEWETRYRNSALALVRWNETRRYGLVHTSLAWNVLSQYPVRVTKTPVLFKWNTEQRKIKTATVDWNVGGTPARKSKSCTIQWKTIARTHKSASLDWRVLNRVTKIATVDWNTPSRPNQLALMEWNTQSPSPVSKSGSTAWNTLQRKSSTVVIGWAAIQRGVRSRNIWWNTLQRKSQLPPLVEWHVWMRAHQSATTEWNERKRTHQNCALGWTTISRTHKGARLILWSTNTRMVGRPCVFTWRTNTRTHQSRAVQWDVFNPVSRSVLVKWNTTKRLTDTGLIEWRMQNRYHNACVSKWNTRSRISCTPPTVLVDQAGHPILDQSGNLIYTSIGNGTLVMWGVRQHISSSALVEWTVIPRKHQTAVIAWTTVGHKHSAYIVEWRILDSVHVSATMEWNIAPKVQGLIQNAASAPWQSAYPSR